MNWTDKDWPNWSDVGKLVEIELKDGTTFIGRLAIADFFSTSERDEVPVFLVVSGETRMLFASNRKWRFVAESPR